MDISKLNPNYRPFRIGKKRKVAVLFEDGREFVVCQGKDAQEKAKTICDALNVYQAIHLVCEKWSR